MSFYQQVVRFLEQTQAGAAVLTGIAGHFPSSGNGARLAIHCIPLSQTPANPLDFILLSESYAQQNIPLIHLWEDVWLQKTTLVQARILAMLAQRKRIHARQTNIIRLGQQQAADFLNAHHLQGYAGAYYKYGLQKGDELVAVAIFSKSRIMHQGAVPYRSYELVRFASQSGVTVTGALGKLLSHFIAQHHPAHLMTYADRDWSSGRSYEKLGFTANGFTPPQLFYVHPRLLQRIYPHRLPAPFTTETELLEAGYFKVYNTGNSRWEWFNSTFPGANS